ncbi:MarR family winged helix-turn-helix transcriptional regulator [Faecalicatena contorta]|uniref:DNA-binding transcriptional regulator, MarR family n=1 Tax=Faecalicatena contorta TaxID=39482 RepID=A0A316A065_9FIRM|nr:MarR family transcriptional regulator [Faecalicatena contorta]PWJ51085.1 DNA-binding MarR family transcriptional regulator [Faecalicatena contorta]SUQ13653.1 DNA-binding transcriptional regulator, MarR family [Faecalicatena contorta]
MEINDLIQRFSHSKEDQTKAIFSTLFIAGNRLQTLFDNDIPDISLKQFMLLTMVRQSKEQLTFTQLGKLLGCSRQNIKKLAYALERKGFVNIRQNEKDVRAACIYPTEKMIDYFENIFRFYQGRLSYLFELYTDNEVEALFTLFMRLYEGIDNLEKRLSDEKNSIIKETDV